MALLVWLRTFNSRTCQQYEHRDDGCGLEVQAQLAGHVAKMMPEIIAALRLLRGCRDMQPPMEKLCFFLYLQSGKLSQLVSEIAL
jgi:hypothetical protein